MTLKKTKVLNTAIVMWLVTVAYLFAETPAGKPAPQAAKEDEYIRVNIHQLVVDPANQQPVVSLSDSDEKRTLFIWIGMSEARAIFSELQGIEHSRPLTHDLLARVIEKVEGKIHHIAITHTENNIFYATIVIEENDKLVEIDARPSDSIVLALKFDAPILISKNLFEKMSIPLPVQTESEDIYGLTLQELTPELAAYLSFKSDRGVMVSSVVKGSQAEKDGFKTGDIIVEVGDKVVGSALNVKDLLANRKAALKIKIFRKSDYLSIILRIR
jgi:bifunctional DNase/RNase